MSHTSLGKEIILLLKKDFTLEWRQKYAVQGVLLYLGCAVFVCYLSVGIKGAKLSPLTWNALFWIIMLFAAVNAVSKSFMQEDKHRTIYYYSLVSPQALILSKLVYNTALMSFLSIMGYALYALVLDSPVQNVSQFFTCILLGGIGFSSTFTLVSAIASRAGNNGSLMAILSIPLMMPLLLILMKFAKNAIDGLEWYSSYDEITLLIAMNVLLISLSYILFPFLWRS